MLALFQYHSELITEKKISFENDKAGEIVYGFLNRAQVATK